MLDLEDNISPKMPFYTQNTQFHLSSFSSFQPYFQATFWRPSRAWISSHLVSLERSRFLVFIGPDLAWFGVIVVEILCMEGEVTQCRKFNSTILGKFISPNLEQTLRSHFVESIWLIILQYVSGVLHHLLLNRYSLLHETVQK